MRKLEMKLPETVFSGTSRTRSMGGRVVESLKAFP